MKPLWIIEQERLKRERRERAKRDAERLKDAKAAEGPGTIGRSHKIWPEVDYEGAGYNRER